VVFWSQRRSIPNSPARTSLYNYTSVFAVHRKGVVGRNRGGNIPKEPIVAHSAANPPHSSGQWMPTAISRSLLRTRSFLSLLSFPRGPRICTSCMYICICTYVHTYVDACTYERVCIYARSRVHGYINIYICTLVYARLSIFHPSGLLTVFILPSPPSSLSLASRVSLNKCIYSFPR